MTRIAVFGAHGRAGRAIVAEAVRQGLEVTALTRKPDGGEGNATRGDVTSAVDVEAAAGVHDVVVSAASPQADPESFFPFAARVLAANVGDKRLIVVGIGTTLEASPGAALWQTPGFPQEGVDWSRAHAQELEVLRGSDLDWLVVAPPPVLLDAAAYAELAVVVVSEALRPRHHRELLAVRP